MKALRMIKGVTRRDKLRNERISQEVGVLPVLDWIQEWKMRWLGQVKRMGDQRYPKPMLEWVPGGGGRAVGRLRRGTSLALVQKNAVYEDRDVWRRLVKSYRWRALVEEVRRWGRVWGEVRGREGEEGIRRRLFLYVLMVSQWFWFYFFDLNIKLTKPNLVSFRVIKNINGDYYIIKQRNI